MSHNLTDYERLSLINQYEILKRLDSHNEDRYDNLIEILSMGYEYYYGDIYKNIDTPFSEGDSLFVIHVLNMYRAIDRYITDHPEDKDLAKHPLAHFCGFDGNEEGAYFSFARFVIYDLGLYGEVRKYEEKTDKFNTHNPVLPVYTRMLQKWEEMGKELKLSRENILEILNIKE